MVASEQDEPHGDGAASASTSALLASSGMGASVGRFLDAVAARVREVVPKAGEAEFRTLADTIPQLRKPRFRIHTIFFAIHQLLVSNLVRPDPSRT